MRLRKRGDTYQAIIYDAAGKRRFVATHCSDRRAAEVAGRRIELEAQDPDSATPKTTLTGALEHLIDHMAAFRGFPGQGHRS